eukprot:TRINITY_DN30729_c0_g1_i1.p1 TRINITY_DN30729_c0_g1~~TRINITY_DN30729_c0_g1_i1.p1  ORF type:complete len:539 (+),score=89.14 TRINITY_DN30729_c0_g1_i1:46-1662(+)
MASARAVQSLDWPLLASLRRLLQRLRVQQPWTCDFCGASNEGFDDCTVTVCKLCKQRDVSKANIEALAAFTQLPLEALRGEHPLALFAFSRANWATYWQTVPEDQRGGKCVDACLAFARARAEPDDCMAVQRLCKHAFRLWPELDDDFDSQDIPLALRDQVKQQLQALGVVGAPRTWERLPELQAPAPLAGNLLHAKLWQKLESCQSVLLAGCGGGYDVYQALPLYFNLRAMGKSVHLASLTFSETHAMRGAAQPIHGLFEVTADTSYPNDYCPEGHLASYLKQRHGIETAVFTIGVGLDQGYAIVQAAYQHLADSLRIDGVLVVDGGSDSLMAGDEEQLATIEEDHISLLAAHDIQREELSLRALVVLGLGVDRFHGCSDAASLRAVAELTAAGGLLGMQQLQADSEPVRFYREAVEYADERAASSSIVAHSVLSAIEGRYGNFHANERTAGSVLYINPMMAMMWSFDLDHVLRRWRPTLADLLRRTRTRTDVQAAIRDFRADLEAKNQILAVEEFPRTHNHGTDVVPTRLDDKRAL